MDNGNNSFQYTYSAKEQEELKRIREKYMHNPDEEDKMEKIRRLDNGVTKKAMVISLTFGIIGTLILGFGMSLVMTELAAIFGLGETAALVSGIIIGVIGGAMASFAYPLYNLVIKQERNKIAPEILRLTDELLK